ncbi:MAG: L-lactate dehydrogenase [Candidatus Pacebacteria bacterium]|nr:L-lactate dehydrogenase [Candidatus Paceibacterota bacterium]PIR60559.1 MAG: L-lactate dehydrogenase [Candidatus Pacebacteria bacterium CG10_big_fil_rev_8_21_14_0_10_44_54]
MLFDNNQVAIIGCGKVGMTAAYSILHAGLVNKLVLFGRSKDKLKGEQLDLEHALSFLPSARILASENWHDLADSDIIIYAAGVAQKPGQTRLDLVDANVKILETMLPNILRHAPNAVMLIVANPVDILTYKAYQIAGWPKGRIFGSGTALDTARFRFHLSQFLHLNPKSIHSYILGEHGDHSFPVISSATVGGQPLANLSNFSESKALQAYEKSRDAAYKIIESKGATYYGIGTVISHIVSNLLRDSRAVLPLSIPLHQYHGHSGIALSVPCVLGRAGVQETLEAKFDWKEKQQLERAVTTLKQYL